MPDGCDTPTECTAFAIGSGVHHGDAFVSDAASLEALEGIVCITGSLHITGSDLTDLVGLESLIGVAGELTIDGNTALQTLEGLENLATAGELYVTDNPELPSCWVWQIEAQTGTECLHQDGATRR